MSKKAMFDLREQRRHGIIDSIDGELMGKLHGILMPELEGKRLEHISEKEGSEFQRRLGQVIDVVLNMESTAREAYDAQRLPVALEHYATIARDIRLGVDKEKKGSREWVM